MEEEGDPLIEHYSAVQRYLCAFTGRSDLAGDLTQETFLRAYRWIRRRGPPENPLPWLKTTARNVAAKFFTGERVEGEHLWARGAEDAREAAEEAGTLEVLVDGETQSAARVEVGRALACLSEQNRTLVSGFYLQGRDCAYLSRVTGVGRRNVKVRLHRARETMRRALGAEEGHVNGHST